MWIFNQSIVIQVINYKKITNYSNFIFFNINKFNKFLNSFLSQLYNQKTSKNYLHNRKSKKNYLTYNIFEIPRSSEYQIGLQFLSFYKKISFFICFPYTSVEYINRSTPNNNFQKSNHKSLSSHDKPQIFSFSAFAPLLPTQDLLTSSPKPLLARSLPKTLAQMFSLNLSSQELLILFLTIIW